MTDRPETEMPSESPLTPSSIADLLAATAVTVAEELRALAEVAGWRPEPGEWSANECVGHLIEAERRGFAGRIRTILGAVRTDGSFEPPILETWDPPAVAAARRDHERPAAELAGEFAAMRADSVVLVQSLTHATWAAVASTPRSGSCGWTSSLRNGSITIGTTSVRCSRSPSPGCGARWATLVPSASSTSSDADFEPVPF